MSKSPKKVLLIIPMSPWNGASRYVFDLAVGLAPHLTVTVAAPSDSLLVAKLKRSHVRTVELHGPTPRTALTHIYFWELYRLLRTEKPDIVHLNSTQSMLLAALAARLAGVNTVIFTAHGWAFNEPVPWLSQMWRWISAACVQLICTKSIAVSYFNAFQAPIGRRIVVIRNGITKPEYFSRHEARELLSRKAQIPKDAFWVGSIGELHINKGVDILIQAAYLVDDIHVVIIGEGEERQNLEKLISDLDLTERVHLLGFIDGAARYMKAFDTFVLPSRTEALGYVLIEAGMAEVPVIASAVGGIPELITDQITGDLVHAFSDVKLAESLAEFKETPNTCRRYAEALKAHVDRHFSLHGMIKRTREVYER